jgi:hypothetical protein
MLARPRLQEEFVYHPPVLKKVVSPAEKFLQAVLVAVVGTGLGIGVGVFLAGRTLPGDSSATASATPAGTNHAPAGGTATAPGTTATQPKTIQAGAQAPPPVSTKPAASAGMQKEAGNQALGLKSPSVFQRTALTLGSRPRLVSASFIGRRTGLRHRHALQQKTAPAQIAPPKVDAPAEVEETRLEIPDGRFRFTVEGDQTAIAYDSQSGVVSTEGQGLFLIEKAQNEPTAVHPQQIPSNLHYKCDQDANCSLIMASLVVPHARMQTASHTGDLAYVPISTNVPSHGIVQAPVYFGVVSR